jgi:hypothetical protein
MAKRRLLYLLPTTHKANTWPTLSFLFLLHPAQQPISPHFSFNSPHTHTHSAVRDRDVEVERHRDPDENGTARERRRWNGSMGFSSLDVKKV